VHGALTREMLFAGTALLVHNGAALAVAAGLMIASYAIAGRVVPRGSRGIQLVSAVVVLLWIATALFHLLAAFHQFRLSMVMPAVALLVAATWRPGSRPLQRRFGRDRVFVRRLGRLIARSRYRWALALFAAAMLPGLLRALIIPPLGWDALTYHAVKAGMWVQTGGGDTMTGPGPWAYYQNMFGGGEVFTAWSMVLLHADTLATSVDVVQWLALGAVLLVLARQLGAREPIASAAVGFILSVPTIRVLVGSGYVEIGLLVAFAAGLVMAIEALHRKDATAVVLALAALGVAAAAKLPMFVIAAAVALLVLAGTAPHIGASGIALAAVVFAVPIAPWLILSASRSGLPLSPVPVNVGTITLGAAPPELRWYMRRPVLHPYSMDIELAVAKRVFAWPGLQGEALGALAALPLLVSIAGLPALARRSRMLVAMVGIVAVISVVEYFAPDFSAIRIYWSETSSRFLLPLFVVLTLVGTLADKASHRRRYFWYLSVAAFIDGIVYCVRGFSRASFEGVAILLGGIVLTALGVRLAGRCRRGRLVVLGLVAVAALSGLEGVRAWLRPSVLEQDVTTGPIPRYWVEAVRQIDDPGDAHRIAVTSGPAQNIDNWFASPFLGRMLQNELRYVSTAADGSIHHWSNVGGSNADELATDADYDAWYRRLRNQRVTDVMSFTPPSFELAWMESHPQQFTRLAGVPGTWGLFEVIER
jgi:hypothetical protein